MKRMLTVALVAILCFVMVLPFVGTTVEAATGSNGGKFTNELSRTTKEITLKNGTKTGVMWTQAKINGPYYGNKDLVVNIAEFDLANTHLSVEVLNHGTYLVDRKTSMATEINKYNTAHPGQTILAAVNGDLFMTGSHSNSNVTKKVLAVSRGIQIIDGEIWATQQTTQENIKATGFDGGKPVDEKNAFGVTSSNQPIVGAPMFTVTMSGNGKTVKTDGLNRLPAIDSITVYNHRVNSSNYALNDSYEIELEVVGSAAFSLNSTVTAKVKAIYPAGSTTRPTIGSNTIVVTARGSRISEVQNKFPVGTNVTFTTTVTDSMNPASMWKTVHDAIGGYILVVKDNAPVVWNTTTSGYPSSFIGIKDDGTVGFVTVTRATNEAYSSLNRNQAYAFCMEYGYNRVFHLDGGGSAQILLDGQRSLRISDRHPDGTQAERPVPLALVVRG
jgi:exopolysaccharide biosynthesis protein